MIWRVLLEAEVRSAPMIVPTVGGEDAPQMRLVEDDDVIEALSSDRAISANGCRKYRARVRLAWVRREAVRQPMRRMGWLSG